MKICKKCDKEFDNEDTFCDKCGSKLTKMGSTQEDSPKKSIKGKIFFIVIGAIILIVLFNFLFLKFYNSPKTDASDNKLVCNSPYILVGKDCCLDQDNNNICDKDETTNTPLSNAQSNQPSSQTQTSCGDGTCQSSESCSSCSTDCGSCKKDLGSSCSHNSDCSSGHCVHNICRSSATYCGDNYCDSGEDYSSCSADCQEPKKTLVCTSNCVDGPAEWGVIGDGTNVSYFPPATLISADYQKTGSKYSIQASFRSNTACDVGIYVSGGTVVSGNDALNYYNDPLISPFATLTIGLETTNLTSIGIMVYDSQNNMHIGQYECGGHANQRNYKFA